MFFPLVILMLIVALLRFYVTKLMNAPDNPLLKKANLSYKTLKNTLFEKDADLSKEDAPGRIDVDRALATIKDDVKDK